MHDINTRLNSLQHHQEINPNLKPERAVIFLNYFTDIQHFDGKKIIQQQQLYSMESVLGISGMCYKV